MVVNATMFLVFVAAWIVAQIVLDIIKGVIARKQHEKLIDTLYLKVSKLVFSTIKDIKEIQRNGNNMQM